MGECGCADVQFEEAFQIAGTQTVVAYQVFHGCEDCDYGPSVSISFLASPKSMYLEGVPIQRVMPNEYGSGRGKHKAGGFGFGLFDQEDLIAAAKEAEEASPIEDYESLADWLHDNGTQLIQDAIARFSRRVKRAPASGEETLKP